MKKILALLFVCAGLTAMAANPLQLKEPTGQRHFAKKQLNGAMVMKTNNFFNDLKKDSKMMKGGEMGTLQEFAKTHDLSQNRLNRAPRRGTIDDVLGNWIYSCLEYVDGVPVSYGMSGAAMDTIYEEEDYYELSLGTMPFGCDPDGDGTAYSYGQYNIVPGYAYYEPSTDEFGNFGGWFVLYNMGTSKEYSGLYDLKLSINYWYLGLANEAGELGGVVSTGTVNNGMIELEGGIRVANAWVSESYLVDEDLFDQMVDMLIAYNIIPSTATEEEAIDYAIYYFADNYMTSLGVDSVYKANDQVYDDNFFVRANATHTFDRIDYMDRQNPTRVGIAVGDTVVNVPLKDKIEKMSVGVFAYQNAANDSVFVWNLWNVANRPDVAFTLDSNGGVMFPWQPVYYEDMSDANTETETYFNNYYNLHTIWMPYSQDGVEGYYLYDYDDDDIPGALNAAMNEITWEDGVDIQGYMYDSVEEAYGYGYSFWTSFINNALTFDFTLDLPEPTETWQLGDVNHDGSIDVGDVTALIAWILGNDAGEFYLEQANVDQDEEGNIDVGDVTAVISIILNN